MKAINKIIILGMAVALFNSCDLTLLPENAVTPENYFQNKSDLELWTNQFYTLLDEPDASAGTNADDMIDKGMGQVIEGTRSAASETGWSWTKLRHINYFLQHSSNCDDETARNQYNGVAQFFRAYFYFVRYAVMEMYLVRSSAEFGRSGIISQSQGFPRVCDESSTQRFPRCRYQFADQKHRNSEHKSH